MIVYYKGEPKLLLNEKLAKKQKCIHNLNKIKNIHIVKLELFDAINEETDKVQLKEYAYLLRQCEFELQKLWKFPEDLRFHRFWLTPKCICAKIDNEDDYGTGYFSFTSTCPLHGW